MTTEDKHPSEELDNIKEKYEKGEITEKVYEDRKEELMNKIWSGTT